MERKSIIQGRLEFGNPKSFAQMLKMYDYRIENYYKNDVLFDEEVFDEDNYLINIPRLISIQEEKWFTNTILLLEYLAQFAISGSIGAWLVHEGKILKYIVIEPESEKGVVQMYLRGQKLASEVGKEQEAIDALNKVIEKHDSHAQAYERRGFVNYIMKNMAGAMYDFNKCISYDPSIPTAYYWRARVHMRNEAWEDAIKDLELATKKAIALQPIYWKARRRKAFCYLELKDYENAAIDLRLFTLRKYEADNPNLTYVREALAMYADTLIHLEKYEDALEAIDRGLKIESQEEYASVQKFLTLRGMARFKMGEGGHDDWRKAVRLGSKEARRYLKENPA
jgi:tetratricopeptide (TPR) repeat protein